jgi:hypothetical protein
MILSWASKLQLLSRDFLRKEFDGIGDIPNHLGSGELFLYPFILRHFKHPNPTSARLVSVALVSTGAQSGHGPYWSWAIRTGASIPPCCRHPVQTTLTASLGLELDDAHVKFFVKDDDSGWGKKKGRSSRSILWFSERLRMDLGALSVIVSLVVNLSFIGSCLSRSPTLEAI